MSVVVPPQFTAADADRLRQGIEDACAAGATYLLGGDTNSGPRLLLTGVALGIVDGSAPLLRTQCGPGDLLYATGPLGRGNAFALTALFPGMLPPVSYLPHARLLEGACLPSLASAAMDTSDGLLATLDELMRLNGVGFRLDDAWPDALDAAAARTIRAAGHPLWLLLAGEHGEFELVFTVPPAMDGVLRNLAANMGWEPLRLGEVTAEQSLVLPLDGAGRRMDTRRIRTLAGATPFDARRYLGELREIDRTMRKGVIEHETR